MQMLIYHLPVSRIVYADPEDDDSSTTTFNTLRHWLIYSDGRIFCQDETITATDGVMTNSERTDWVQLPTPPQMETVAGTFEYGGLPGVVTASGKAYLWASRQPTNDAEENEIRVLSQEHRVHDWPHMWVPFNEPVPGTPAYVEYNR